ncbi:MAG: hypothetical protein DMG11_16685 [Acidobacteria bacterium]|nr:MAG: hypothetical protein DMG11_16685 [Acidobacteriota bacterium]
MNEFATKGNRNHKKHKRHKKLMCFLCLLWFLPLAFQFIHIFYLLKVTPKRTSRLFLFERRLWLGLTDLLNVSADQRV